MALTRRFAAKPPRRPHRWNSNSTRRLEQLETRTMLTVGASPPDLIAPQWFETIAPPAADAQAVGQVAWNGRSATVRSDEWIVQVADSRLAGLRSVADVAGLLPPAGFDFQVVRGLGRAGQVVIRTPGAPAEAVKRWLAKNPNVESFGPNQIVSIQQVPNDTDYGELWGLNNTGQWWGTPGADISAEEAWDLTRGSTTTVVGVIDTGIDYNHPDLYGNVWINQAEIPADRRANLADLDGDGLITFYDLNDPRNQGVGKITDLNGDGLIGGADILADWQPGGAGGWADGVSQPGDTQFVDDLVGWNFVNNTNDPYDDQSHGSHVSGTIAGMGNNNRGVAGVNWKASVMALKSFNSDGYSELDDDVRALNYATMQRTQFGVNIRTTNNSWGWEGEFDQALYDAIAASGAAGMLFVAAAGNSSENSDVLPHYPAAYNLDNIVSVAATDGYDAMAYFSNYGATTVDLAAPGDWIYSSVPGYSWYPDTYSYYSGTSMATPHVVGVAALAWTLVPGATPAQVKAALMQGVDRLPDVGSSHTVTDGRLNARRTLDLIRAQANQPPTIGSLTASPNPVPVGSVLTLTANSVADADGTVANVKFYRESNGVPGLQAGSGGDLLLATDAAAPYQASVNTTGLTPGSYTYYAVATDNRGATSAVGSAASTVIAGLPELSIDHVAMAEGNSGTPALTFRLWLTAASSQPVTVRFATSSGTATVGIDYLATSGTLTFAPGEVSKLIPVTILGDTRFETDETFFMNLSGATGAVITKPMVQGTILNDDARPSLTIADVGVRELASGSADVAFQLTLSAASDLPVTVNYATANGTAVAGSDYGAVAGSITIPAGVRTATIYVPVSGDTALEPDETFFLNLSGAVNATIADAQGAGKILNDDASIAIGDVSLREGQSGTTAFTFTVTLSAAAAFPVTVKYATANNTAVSGSDYTALALSTLTFNPGETRKTITVAALGDAAQEPDETFFVNLSGAVNATIADAQGVGRILNDDASIAVGDLSLREGQSGTTAFTFTVTLSAVTPFPVTVRYKTVDGTAIAGTDYTALALSTLTFNPGETRKTVTVAVRGDATVEANETFKVVLSDSTNAVISRATGLGTILNDDATTALSALMLGSSDATTTTTAGLPILAATDAALDSFGLGGGLHGRPARGRAAVRLA